MLQLLDFSQCLLVEDVTQIPEYAPTTKATPAIMLQSEPAVLMAMLCFVCCYLLFVRV